MPPTVAHPEMLGGGGHQQPVLVGGADISVGLERHTGGGGAEVVDVRNLAVKARRLTWPAPAGSSDHCWPVSARRKIIGVWAIVKVLAPCSSYNVSTWVILLVTKDESSLM